MYHIPLGALVVPYTLPDLHRVVAQTGLRPVVADEAPKLTARAKNASTTVLVGTTADVDAAVRAWPGPVIAVGGPVDGAIVTIPSGADCGLLHATAAPVGSDPVVVGDVHNCTRTLAALLDRLGVIPGAPTQDDPLVVFVGDVVDKGGAPGDDLLGALRAVYDLCRHGQAVLVRGNHEQMLVRRHIGVSDPTPHSAALLAAVAAAPDGDELVRWLGTTPLAFKLDPVKGLACTVGHASATAAAFTSGAKARFAAEQACLFGRKTGTVLDGIVVHGHVEVDEVTVTRTDAGYRVNVDTGACAGNALSAVRFTGEPHEPAVYTIATHQGDLGTNQQVG